MSERADVLIVGGGVIGLTAAYYLAGEGLAVTVADSGDLGRQASWAGAGIIPPGNPRQARTPFEKLKALSSAMYPGLSQELREQTGIDNGFSVCGGVEVLAGDEELASDEWRAEGVAFEELAGQELHRRFPALAARWERGYFLPEMAQVRNPRHLKALIAACAARGVDLRPGCAAKRFDASGGRILGAETERERFRAARYLIASGAWSGGLLQPLGWRAGIRPVRGQIALLQPDQPPLRSLLLQGERYLVPRPDGRVLVGSTVEDAGFDARPTAGAIAELLEFAASLVPALAAAPLERCWAGLRPGSADGLPYLGGVPGYDNLFVAASHFRAGIQLSPATGRVLTQLLLGQPTLVPLDPFRLDR